MDSNILSFYSGEAPDSQGRFLHQIQQWSDAKLESVHDYIQWLFPLPERSAFNTAAPVLTADVIKAFQSGKDLQENLRRSLLCMLRFYGLKLTSGPNKILRGRDFETKAANWLRTGNHNHLRIARILRSLMLLGLQAEAKAFFDCLSRIYEAEERKTEPSITEETFRYWNAAVMSAREGNA